jgi:hypothetical protein
VEVGDTHSFPVYRPRFLDTEKDSRVDQNDFLLMDILYGSDFDSIV